MDTEIQNKDKNWLKKHPILSLLLGLAVLGFIGVAVNGGGSNNNQANQINHISSVQPIYSSSPSIITIPQVKASQTPTPTVTPSSQPTSGQVNGVSNTPNDSGLSNDNYYTNSNGDSVHSPAYSDSGSVPAGATAQCSDGTYSFSQHRQGTCSHHGGVAQWL